jgi:exopolysaccharide biosynthesis protein
VNPTSTPKIDKYWFRVNPSDLILIDNTIEKETSSDLTECKSGINAFYYDKSNQPLGWLIVDSKLVNRDYKSNLLNGFVYIQDSRFKIQDSRSDTAEYGHQSGPILIFNGQYSMFNLDNKVFDKRSVAIQTDDDQAVFAYFEYATLAQLPEKIMELGKQNGFSVINAINLDGGNSAAFWTENTRVSEAFFSGGFWCVK